LSKKPTFDELIKKWKITTHVLPPKVFDKVTFTKDEIIIEGIRDPKEGELG